MSRKAYKCKTAIIFRKGLGSSSFILQNVYSNFALKYCGIYLKHLQTWLQTVVREKAAEWWKSSSRGRWDSPGRGCSTFFSMKLELSKPFLKIKIGSSIEHPDPPISGKSSLLLSAFHQLLEFTRKVPWHILICKQKKCLIMFYLIFYVQIYDISFSQMSW